MIYSSRALYSTTDSYVYLSSSFSVSMEIGVHIFRFLGVRKRVGSFTGID
jgi:hypothetical protein